MKLWQKGFEVSKEIESFTVGKDREMDLFLAPHDVLGSLAHIQMLETIGLLEKDEYLSLSAALKSLYKEIESGGFSISEGVEDVHSQVELLLTQRLGDMGKKIHSGRSRNDQVLVDLKLFIRHEIQEIVECIQPLFSLLLNLAEQYKQVIIPGYTHYQVAMPSSFGLWFSAYAESLTDDVMFLQMAYRMSNKNPLGSAAGYGSSFPLNRTLTTQLLGFEDLHYNVVYAQMGRGKTEKTVADALASVAATLGKMSQDICLYISQNFAFLSFPDELTTGSSIMPHKKNPDVFEIMRAKANRIQALPNQISLITGNLASGYHRDLQLIKEDFLPVFSELKNMLAMAHYALSQVIIRKDVANDSKYTYMFSVELVNDLVMKGLPFREAYKKVGEMIASQTYEPITAVQHSHEGSIGNLCLPEIQQLMEKHLDSFHFGTVKQAIQNLLAE